MDGVELRRWIVVAVVGADHKTVLAGVAQDVRKIVGVLAGDPHVVGRERIIGKSPSLAAVAVGEIVPNTRHPLRADPDKAPTDLRKLLWKLFLEQRMKRADDGQAQIGSTRL